MFEDGGSFRRRPRGFRKRPNLKGPGGGRFEHQVAAAAAAAAAANECGNYANDGSESRTRSASQLRYAPYDLATGVLSPPPDYGNFKDFFCSNSGQIRHKFGLILAPF